MKEDLPAAVRALKLTLGPWEVRAANDFDRFFAAMASSAWMESMYTHAGPVLRGDQKRIIGLCVKEPVTVDT